MHLPKRPELTDLLDKAWELLKQPPSDANENTRLKKMVSSSNIAETVNNSQPKMFSPQGNYREQHSTIQHGSRLSTQDPRSRVQNGVSHLPPGSRIQSAGLSQCSVAEISQLGQKSEECTSNRDSLIRHQQTRMQQLLGQVEQGQKEINQLQKMLKTSQTELSEIRGENDRKTQLLSTLSTESTAKDSMLRQLDSALGRLTAGWQEREEQRMAELKKLRESEQNATERLQITSRDLTMVETEYESKLKRLQSDYQESIKTNEEGTMKLQRELQDVTARLSNALNRTEELESRLTTKADEADSVQRELLLEKQKTTALEAKCEQIHQNWRKQIDEARMKLKEETKLQKNELKKLQHGMKKVTEVHEQKIMELRQKLGSEYELRLNRALSEQERQYQEQLMRTQEDARTAVRDASDRYLNDLEQLRLNAQNELSRQIGEAENRIDAERERVKITEKQVERWRLAAREAEESRSLLASRMNDLLQSRCTEAMQMIQTKNDPGYPPTAVFDPTASANPIDDRNSVKQRLKSSYRSQISPSFNPKASSQSDRDLRNDQKVGHDDASRSMNQSHYSIDSMGNGYEQSGQIGSECNGASTFTIHSEQTMDGQYSLHDDSGRTTDTEQTTVISQRLIAVS